jgi:hypothetical protein
MTATDEFAIVLDCDVIMRDQGQTLCDPLPTNGR